MTLMKLKTKKTKQKREAELPSRKFLLQPLRTCKGTQLLLKSITTIYEGEVLDSPICMTAEDVRFIWGWWSSTGNMHLCKNRFREELYSKKFKKQFIENQVDLVKNVVYQIVGKGEVIIKDLGCIFTIQGPVRGVHLGFKKESYFEDEMMYGKIDYQELLSTKDNLKVQKKESNGNR